MVLSVDERVIRRIGRGIIHRGKERGRDFKAMFGVVPSVAVELWESCEHVKKVRPKHVLWGLMLLKLNSNQTSLACMAHTTRKTLRKWAWKVIGAISEHFYYYIDLDNRYNGDRGKTCLLTVDGTDFRIRERGNPHRHVWYTRSGKRVTVNPKWHTKKFNGPGVRYEIGVNIQTGDICWVYGPFPCGRWPDKKIFAHKLQGLLDEDEEVECDGHYRYTAGCRSKYEHLNAADKRAKSRARARHEAVNRRFKQFGILGQRFRHNLKKHKMCMRAVAVCVQLTFEHEGVPFHCRH